MNPARDVDLFERLDALGIPHRTVLHPPVFTVEESRALRGELPGGHLKNLLLRDKKRNVFLVVALEERAVDLKALAKRIGASGTVSFASAETLLELLGVIPGAVTPFGIVNDAGRRVRVVLDEGALAHDVVWAHPLRNDRSTAVAPRDLVTFLEAEGHAPTVISLD